MSVSSIVQIAILYFAIYAILKGAHGSRFGQALMGGVILATVAAVFTYVFHFDVLSKILRLLLIYLALSSVVIFQQEIRRFLSQLGAFGQFERRKYEPTDVATAELIVSTLMALAKKRIGALVAFERGISLRGYEETGVRLNATFSRQLVETVFTPPLPLHDGGMTIRNGRISAAHCIFPVSNNPDLLASGMRHRAAVGITEDTDAMAVVVSEESGNISIAHNGRLYRYTGDARETSVCRWITKVMRETASDRGALQPIFDWLQRQVVKLSRRNQK